MKIIQISTAYMPDEEHVNIYGLGEDGAVYYYHRDISKWRVLIPVEIDSSPKNDEYIRLKKAAKDVIDDWNVTNDRNTGVSLRDGKLNWDSLHVLESVLTNIDK